MNTLKKFSVETHKGWASFQVWIKKWNKIMAVIFSALGIILLLSIVIVNALEVHEENLEDQKVTESDSRFIDNLRLLEVCHWIQINTCLIYCNAGISTDTSKELNFHWETNFHCHSEGMSIEISSSIQFPKFTITSDWLKGRFELKELQIDMENIFVICENAFTTEVFKSMQKLVFVNVHLHTMDTKLLQKLFMEQHYKHLTIAKSYSNQLLGSMEENLYYNTILHMDTDTKFQIRNQPKSNDTMWLTDFSQPVIISLTIVGCILSFSLGFLIRCNRTEQKMFLNKINDTNRVIFLVEKDASCRL